MLDGVGDRPTRTNFNGDRVPHRPSDQCLDRRRYGRRKEGTLTILATLEDNAADIGEEPHVEHAIGFVEDEKLHSIQTHGPFTEMVEQSSRGCDDDIHAALEVVALLAVADATVNQTDSQVGEFGEFLEILVSVNGQFAGGFENQTPWARGMRTQLAQDRKGKGRGFPGAGLC